MAKAIIPRRVSSKARSSQVRQSSFLFRAGSFLTIVDLTLRMGLYHHCQIRNRTAFLQMWTAALCPKTMALLMATRPRRDAPSLRACAPRPSRRRNFAVHTFSTLTQPAIRDSNWPTGSGCKSRDSCASTLTSLIWIWQSPHRKLQSVTNWFQNQRSQAKKHKDEPRSAPAPSPMASDALSASREQDSPPATLHWQHPSALSRPRRPSLSMPENGRPSAHKLSSSAVEPLSRMSLPPPTHSVSSPRARRSVTPYTRYIHSDEPRLYKIGAVESVRTEDILARNRRSRPQPHQLQALKELLRRTSTPSIEERTSLALEIGM